MEHKQPFSILEGGTGKSNSELTRKGGLAERSAWSFQLWRKPDMVPNPRRQRSSLPLIADQDNSPDRFLTAEEAAEFLGGITARTLVRWARQGLVPAYPLGEGRRRLWRFRSVDLRQWMESRRRGPVLADGADSGRLFPATDASEQRRFQ
jgi:excisionase family DNA binding protein